MALVKSGKATGVTLLKVMPGWWKTSIWRYQLPEDANIYANFDINSSKIATLQMRLYATALTLSCPIRLAILGRICIRKVPWNRHWRQATKRGRGWRRILKEMSSSWKLLCAYECCPEWSNPLRDECSSSHWNDPVTKLSIMIVNLSIVKLWMHRCVV